MSSQLKAGLLRFERESDDVFKNYVRFTYRPSVSGKFEDRKGRWLRVSGIKVKGVDSQLCDRISIYVSHGLICGYAFENKRSFKADTTSVDATDIRIETLDTPTAKLEKLIPKTIQSLINWADVFDVELNGKTYYHLKNTGDGNFIGIDETGTFVAVSHDPPEILQLEGEQERIFVD